MFISALILSIYTINAQEQCNHKILLIDFLCKISSINYTPTIKDYNNFFDSQSEIEIGLQEKYKVNQSDKKKMIDDNKSYAINHLLNNNTVKHLINLFNDKNCEWIILRDYKKGSATIVYEVGLDCSSEFIKIQMVNWQYKGRCKICDILDSNDVSIFFP